MFHSEVDVSVIVPISYPHANLGKMFEEYSEPFRRLGKRFEFVFVVNGGFEEAFESLRKLKERFSEIKVIKFAVNFSESIALMTGFHHARGKFVFTLPAHFQVEPTGILGLLRKLEEGCDLVVGRRFPQKHNLVHKTQSSIFHSLIRWTTGAKYKDLMCGLRAMKREVALSLDLTGDSHRFIPILAAQRGYTVEEIDVAQRREDVKAPSYRFGISLRRFFDVFALYFMVKFTRKPLRFFGAVGASLSASGLLICLYLTAVRLLGEQAIAGRPILLLGLILMVVGIQVASLGLLVNWSASQTHRG